MDWPFMMCKAWPLDILFGKGVAIKVWTARFLPSGLQSLTFGMISTTAWSMHPPSGLQSLTFGTIPTKVWITRQLPSGKQSLTFGMISTKAWTTRHMSSSMQCETLSGLSRA